MKAYWLTSRPYSYTAALVPVLLGTSLAKLLFPSLTLNWINFMFTLMGCIAAQAVSNLVNDLFDFKTGLDKPIAQADPNAPKKVGRYNALISGDLTWRQVAICTAIIGCIGLTIGIYFAITVGGPILFLVLAGGVLAVEYTAPPLKLKYRALGDFTVLLTFGITMTLGAYTVQAHTEPTIFKPSNLAFLLIYTLPSAMLVVAILQANNHRDRETDKNSGAHTLSNVLSFRTSKYLLLTLVIGPFVLCGCYALAGSFLYGPQMLAILVVLVTLPALKQTVTPILNDRYERSVPQIAQLHGKFGILLAASVVIQILVVKRFA